MSRLDGLHPELRKKAEALIALSSAAGIHIAISQGLRTIEQQDALYAQGRTAPGPIVTNAQGGHSYHNFGLAFDIVVIRDSKATWDDKVDVNENDVPDYVDVGTIGEQLGLEWGGRWKFRDLPHFQMTFGLSLEELRNGKKPPNEAP